MPSTPELCSHCAIFCEYQQNTTAIIGAEAESNHTNTLVGTFFQAKPEGDSPNKRAARKAVNDALRAEKRVAQIRKCPNV